MGVGVKCQRVITVMVGYLYIGFDYGIATSNRQPEIPSDI